MTLICPGCSSAMQRRTFDRKPQGQVELDLCFGCKAIWFDQYESLVLAPGGVIELFREIHAHEQQPMQPLTGKLPCPKCRTGLTLTHDLQRTNRIAYYRCVRGDGRFTTFFQFLREKNFVRSLSNAEIAQLSASVKQVRCSSCGAPVNLSRDPACSYCKAPISILDPDAVALTLAQLSEAERVRHHVNPQAVMDGALAGQAVERRLARVERSAPAYNAGGETVTGGLVDLVGAAIAFLLSD